MAIPTAILIEAAPRIFEAALGVFDKWKTRPKPEPVDPSADPRAQLAAIVARLQALEETESSQAEVVKNIAGQLEGLSAGLADLSRRTTTALWIAGVAVAASVVAVALAALR
jgi:hypothetical protein